MLPRSQSGWICRYVTLPACDSSAFKCSTFGNFELNDCALVSTPSSALTFGGPDSSVVLLIDDFEFTSFRFI